MADGFKFARQKMPEVFVSGFSGFFLGTVIALFIMGSLWTQFIWAAIIAACISVLTVPVILIFNVAALYFIGSWSKDLIQRVFIFIVFLLYGGAGASFVLMQIS